MNQTNSLIGTHDGKQITWTEQNPILSTHWPVDKTHTMQELDEWNQWKNSDPVKPVEPLEPKNKWWKKIVNYDDVDAHLRPVQIEWTPRHSWFTPSIEVNTSMKEVAIYLLCLHIYISWDNINKRRKLWKNKHQQNLQNTISPKNFFKNEEFTDKEISKSTIDNFVYQQQHSDRL